jgi:large subunit ribosomal protein L3
MRRCGVIAQKKGMTRLFLESGESCPVTLFSLEDCTVLMRKECANGSAIQVGSGKVKNLTKPLKGHFAKLGVAPKKVLSEFFVPDQYSLPGGSLFQADYFDVGMFVDVTGYTIGRGFAGPMKRHNLSGLRASHGVSVSHRSHGSTGHRKDPARVFKGKKMAGHMGCKKVTVQNLRVMAVDVERALILVKGAVPGFEGGWVKIRDAIKKKYNFDKEKGIRFDEKSVNCPVDAVAESQVPVAVDVPNSVAVDVPNSVAVDVPNSVAVDVPNPSKHENSLEYSNNQEKVFSVDARGEKDLDAVAEIKNDAVAEEIPTQENSKDSMEKSDRKLNTVVDKQ